MKKNIAGFSCRAVLRLCLVTAMLAASAGASADDIEAEELVLGYTYTYDAIFSKHYFFFTPSQDGTLITYGNDVVELYPDGTFTLPDDGEPVAGFTNSSGSFELGGATVYGKICSLGVKAGETYYLMYTAQSVIPSSFYAVLSDGSAPEVAYVNPEEGSALDVVSTGIIGLRFDRAVLFDGVTLSSGGNSEEAPYNYANGVYTFTVKYILYEWLSTGAVAEGDEVALTFANLRAASDENALYDGTGTLTLTWKAPAVPAVLESAVVPSVARDYWESGDPDGIITLTFSKDLLPDSDPGQTAQAKWSYGSRETENGFYVDTLGVSISGNTLTVDLTGKSRTRREMLPAIATEYDTVLLSVNLVKSADGNYVYSPGSGSTGSFQYQTDYTDEGILAGVSSPAESAGGGSSPAEYFSPDGKRLSAPQKGLNIVRSGGGVKKSVVR